MKKASLFLSFFVISLFFQNLEASYTATAKLKKIKKCYGLIVTNYKTERAQQKDYFSQDILEREQTWFKRLRRKNSYKKFEVEVLLNHKLRPKEILLIGKVIKKKRGEKESFFVEHPLYKMKLPLTGKRYVLASGDRISFRVRLHEKTHMPEASIGTLYQ